MGLLIEFWVGHNHKGGSKYLDGVKGVIKKFAAETWRDVVRALTCPTNFRKQYASVSGDWRRTSYSPSNEIPPSVHVVSKIRLQTTAF